MLLGSFAVEYRILNLVFKIWGLAAAEDDKYRRPERKNIAETHRMSEDESSLRDNSSGVLFLKEQISNGFYVFGYWLN